jgi:hypothetical protein
MLGPQWDAMPAPARSQCEVDIRAALNPPDGSPASVIHYASDLAQETYGSRFLANEMRSGKMTGKDKADAAFAADVQTQFANERMDTQDKADFQRETGALFSNAVLASAIVIAVSAVLISLYQPLRKTLKELAIVFTKARAQSLDGKRAVFIQWFKDSKERFLVRCLAIAIILCGFGCFLWLLDGYAVSRSFRTAHDLRSISDMSAVWLPIYFAVAVLTTILSPPFFLHPLLNDLFRITRRVVEWEGPARFEQEFVNGERKWVRRGNPYGDPMADDPRAASATGPAKPGFTKVFNDRTGEYEWVQSMAAKDGNPNVTPEAAPFTPKGEYGDTPDVKPEGEFI